MLIKEYPMAVAALPGDWQMTFETLLMWMHCVRVYFKYRVGVMFVCSARFWQGMLVSGPIRLSFELLLAEQFVKTTQKALLLQLPADL